MLVFADETGMDMRDNLRKYRYSFRGKPVVLHKLAFCGHSVSAIVDTIVILDYKLTQDTMDSDEFKDLVENLLPMLMR